MDLKTPKNTYICLQLKNMQVIGQNPLIALRKCIRKLIYNAKQKQKDVDIFAVFKDIKITLLCCQTNKQIHYIVSIVKPTKPNLSLYYKLDYELEIYRKLQNI